MPGWNVRTKPKEGIQLYFGASDATSVATQTDGKITMYVITAFLDRKVCEQLKKTINQAEKYYWQRTRRRK